jgi:hypothetical protein
MKPPRNGSALAARARKAGPHKDRRIRRCLDEKQVVIEIEEGLEDLLKIDSSNREDYDDNS